MEQTTITADDIVNDITCQLRPRYTTDAVERTIHYLGDQLTTTQWDFIHQHYSGGFIEFLRSYPEIFAIRGNFPSEVWVRLQVP